MFTSAEKTTKPVTAIQQKAAGTCFFRKAADETFFGSQKHQGFFDTRSNAVHTQRVNIQAKLNVSKPDDPQEKEADAVADKVMRKSDPHLIVKPPDDSVPSVQKKEDEEKDVQAKQETNAQVTLQRKPEEKEDEPVQPKLFRQLANQRVQRSTEDKEEVQAKTSLAIHRKPEPLQLETDLGGTKHISQEKSPQTNVVSLYRSEVIQQSGRGPPESSMSFHSDLSESKGKGSPLPDHTRSFMEQRFGADFNNVKVHTDERAQQMNAHIHAKAFAHGSDIYFSKGSYAPGTSGGDHLLAHELTHTIQQGASRVAPKTAAAKEADLVSKTGLTSATHSNNIIQRAAIALHSGGSSLSSEAREYFEDSFKADVSDIRIHTGFEAAMITRSRRLPVIVQGRDIIFDPSRYSPDSEEGGALLARQIAESLKQRSISVPGLASQLNQGINEVKAGTIDKPKAGVKKEEPKLPPRSKDKKGAPLKGKPSAKGKQGGPKKKRKPEKGDGPPPKSVKKDPKKSPSSPDEDPAFQKVVGKARATAKGQKKHDDPEAKATHAQKAANAVTNEAKGAAQKRKTEGMEEVAKEDKPFDDESFKADLLKKIEEVTPKNLEEATEFKENNKIGEVKSAMGQKVTSEKDKTAGPVEKVTGQPLQVNDADNKKPVPLPPTPAGNRPPAIGAQDAAPKPKLDHEISMEAQSRSLDDEMKANNITETQLEKSNEPSFVSALKEKRNAQKDAKEKPVLYRNNEAQEIKATQASQTADASRSMASMFGVRGKNFDGVVKQQQATKSKDEQEREAVVKKIEGMYAQTEATVNSLLTTAETAANLIFDTGSEKARIDFENFVDLKMRAYKRKRYSGFWGGLRWAKDKLFGMPDAVNKFYVDGRQRYLNQMNGVITQVAKIVTTNLNAAKQAIKSGKKQITDYVSTLQGSLKNVGKEAAENISDKFDNLENSVNDKRAQLIDGLARKYVANLKKLDDRITELKEANKGLVAKAIGFLKEVWKVIKNLYELFKTILSRIISVVGLIIEAPGKFFDNLGSAFKQGFDRFQNRIGEHLENGLMIWLSTQVGVTGLKMPEKFDVSAIFGLALQVMGITYENIRERAVILIGEERVALLENATEAGADLFQRIKSGGLGAIWDLIKEKLTDFKDMIWEAIKTLIKNAVIKAAITFVLSLLNPVAAFVKACMAIYQFIMMLVRMKDRIIDLLNSILDAVAMIAAGSVDKAAAFVEAAFAKSIPIVIGFLAALLGLNDIGSRVRGIILRIKEKMNKVIDWGLNKAYGIARPAIEAAMRVKNKGKEMLERGKEKGKLLIEKGKEKVREAVGGGGTPEERLENGLHDAQRAVNKYAGKKVAHVILKPILSTIKIKYGFQSLELIPAGTKWAVKGTINPTGDLITEAEVPQTETEGAGSQETTTEGITLEVGCKLKRKKQYFKVTEVRAKDKKFVMVVININTGEAKAGYAGKQPITVDLADFGTKYLVVSENVPNLSDERLEALNFIDGQAPPFKRSWDSYEREANKVLNHRYHNFQRNPSGLQWEHLVEQNQPFPSTIINSVENIYLSTKADNQTLGHIFGDFKRSRDLLQDGSDFYYLNELRENGNICPREYLRNRPINEHVKWKEHFYKKLRIRPVRSDKNIDNRGPFRTMDNVST